MIGALIVIGAVLFAIAAGLLVDLAQHRAAELHHARVRDDELQALKALAQDLEERKQLRLTLMASTLEGPPRRRKDWLN